MVNGYLQPEDPYKVTLEDSDGDIVDVKPNLNSGSNELLVNLEGHICADNSTNEPLSAGKVFTGSGWQSTLDYGTISIDVTADQDSATDGLQIQWSVDGVNINNTDEFTILANNPKTFTFGAANQYVRVVYTNGAVDQTYFVITTILRRVYVKPSSHRINDSIVGQDDAELVKAVITGESVNTGNFVNIGAIEGQVGNNLLVSVDQVEETTNSLKVIDYSHAELHSGDHYLAKSFFSLAKNATFDFLIITPDSSRWAHMTASIGNSTSVVTASLYKDATYSAIGTEWTTWNRNHNYPNDNTTKIYLSPTITATGTFVDNGSLGAGKNLAGSLSRDAEEKVLAQNTIYLVRITEQNITSTVINWAFDWYEHTNS